MAACTSQPPDQKQSQSVPESSTPVLGSASYLTANSFADLAERSTIIAIGRVIQTENIINMARDADDPMKDDDRVFGVGQVYQFHIDRYLKGAEEDVIHIVQPEGFIGQGMSKTEEDIERAKINYDYIPLSMDKNYLMFLHPMFDPPDLGYYVGVAHPWRFDLSDPRRVIPESPWGFASMVFPPQSLEFIIQQIEHPESFPPTPPPEPITSPYP